MADVPGTNLMPTIDQIRNTIPMDRDHLWHWVHQFTGVKISRCKVCSHHQPPFDFFAKQWFDQPDNILILGARGSGKSFLEAVLTHMESRFYPNLGTRILGGSKDQSRQIYDALKESVQDGYGNLGSDGSSVYKLLTTEARYYNGSHVSILAASSKSVRGPHIPRLKLDEVDEIDEDIRESAVGMVMAKNGIRASTALTSTWHRIGGPMSKLLEQGRAGAFPTYEFCTFDVLERCSESRSGKFVGGDGCYEHCPACPIKTWCHADRDRNGNVPLAKLSDGHYAIDSLIGKLTTTSKRVFEADYCCKGPKADGLWFSEFDDRNISVALGEYNPQWKVHNSIDSGVFTGAVFFQVQQYSGRYLINCFDEYLSEGKSALTNGTLIRQHLGTRFGQGLRYSTDPAGASRTAIGPTVIGEYQMAGIQSLDRWPISSVTDSLALLEGLVRGADGSIGLYIHPRCRNLIAAFQSYKRAKRAGQFQDYPEDPQHPHEDMIDALRGGLKLELPYGRQNRNTFGQRRAGQVI